MFKKHRLPYLLLGLGIGIIVTNAVYTFYPQWTYREYTDEEIIEKAKELGMVFIKDNINITATTNQEDIQNHVQNEKEAEELRIEEEIETQEGGKTQEEEIYNEMAIEDVEEITFSIKYGDSLIKVSRGLEKAGIINDAEDFLKYGKAKGIDKRLRVGDYKLTKGLDYDTIISILLKQEELNKNNTK